MEVGRAQTECRRGVGAEVFEHEVGRAQELTDARLVDGGLQVGTDRRRTAAQELEQQARRTGRGAVAPQARAAGRLDDDDVGPGIDEQSAGIRARPA